MASRGRPFPHGSPTGSGDRGEWKPRKVRELEARLAEQRAITLREWAYRSIEGSASFPCGSV